MRTTQGKPLWQRPWTMFWAGFALRAACILIGHTYRIRTPWDHFGFGWEMGRIARSLALGQGYANPFNGPSGPTAWTPPLYPLLMALSFKLFGIYTNAAALFLLLCNSVFSALIAPAVYEIARHLFDDRNIARRASTTATPVALWAGWLWAVYPAALQYAIHWLWEMSLSTCLFTWAIVFVLRLRQNSHPQQDRHPQQNCHPDPELAEGEGSASGHFHLGRTPHRLWALFGLLWGLEALSNASLLLCLPAMMIWIAWPDLRSLHWPGLLRQLTGAVLACAVIAAVMAPWILRNERTLHAFIPTRSNLGVELYESTLPSHDAFPWGTAMPLWSGDPEFRRYVRMGEVPYAKVRGEEAKARLRADPGLFVRYTIRRFFFFWDDTPHPVEGHPAREFFRNLSYDFLSLCGLLGLALALRRRLPGAGLLALCFVLVPLPYYFVTVQARFRHPLEPLIAVLAVYLFRSADTTRTWSFGVKKNA